MWPIVFILVVGSALLVNPFQGDGWYWEIGNAIGFLAFALLLVLIFNGRGKLGHTFRHRWLGFFFCFSVVGHCLWFLLGDPATLAYLNWGAPHYMVAGVFAAALVLFLTFTSLTSVRKRNYPTQPAFKKWHRALSICVLFASFAHIVLSGFYFQQIWQISILLIVSLAAYAAPGLVGSRAEFSRLKLAIVSMFVLTLFILIRMSNQL